MKKLQNVFSFISPLSLDVWIYKELENHSKWLASYVIKRFPFCIPGVSILFKKPMKKPPNLFSFLSPLSLDVWIYMELETHSKWLASCIIKRFPYLHSRSQYPIQEAHEETAKSVFISVAAITGCVDLHGRCISWRLCIALHIGKVKLVFSLKWWTF